jgi:hypothetical protein
VVELFRNARREAPRLDSPRKLIMALTSGLKLDDGGLVEVW